MSTHQIVVNRKHMREFFLKKLNNKGISHENVKVFWFSNSIENIFVSKNSPYCDSDFPYPPLTLYELMTFCMYSGASFMEVMQHTCASYDYFHCCLYQKIYDSFYKLMDVIKTNNDSIYSSEIEGIFINPAINLWKYIYSTIKEYFSSINIPDLPFRNNNIFIIQNYPEVFDDLDAFGGYIYRVMKTLNNDTILDSIIAFNLVTEIRRHIEDFKNNVFYDIRQRRMVHTHGYMGGCPYCGCHSISTYTDGTAECDRCGLLFRYS